MARRVEIEGTGFKTASITIDGVDVSQYVVAYDLQQKADLPPVLTLHLRGGTIYRGEASVVLLLPEGLHEALTALGWVPPDGG
jgi:hypothetical protein